ncbi:MAG: response regulator [Myxococcota bacterium]|nr:response regulator [Myxococcota bacterium]
MSGRLDGVTVLVVDDHDDTREVFGLVLLNAGAQVLSASNADEALELVAQRVVRVLVCDLAMPRIDGLDLIRRVRARDDEKRGIPAVAVSGRALPRDVGAALDAGYDAHVAKPVDPAQLIECVRQLAGA